MQLTTTAFFGDECVLTIKKVQERLTEEGNPKPHLATAWARPPVCPGEPDEEEEESNRASNAAQHPPRVPARLVAKAWVQPPAPPLHDQPMRRGRATHDASCG